MKTATLLENIEICALGHYLPKKIITCEEIAKLSGLTSQEIFDNFGVLEKRIALDEHPSEMGVTAAKNTLQKSAVTPQQIDFIIYAGNGLHDYQFWSPAAKIQAEIKADNAFVFDINNGCTSPILGLFLAAKLLENTNYSYGLLVASDTLSKFIDYNNPNSLPFFSKGDGASAVLLKKGGVKNRLISFALHSDGNYVDLNKIVVGGTKAAQLNHKKQDHCVHVDKTHKNMVKLITQDLVENYVEVVKQALNSANLKLEQISYFLFNQVSIGVINRVLETLKITQNKTYATREKFGHMTIDCLFALEHCLSESKLKTGDYVVMSSMGVGFHWNACVIKI